MLGIVDCYIEVWLSLFAAKKCFESVFMCLQTVCVLQSAYAIVEIHSFFVKKLYAMDF